MVKTYIAYKDNSVYEFPSIESMRSKRYMGERIYTNIVIDDIEFRGVKQRGYIFINNDPNNITYYLIIKNENGEFVEVEAATVSAQNKLPLGFYVLYLSSTHGYSLLIYNFSDNQSIIIPDITHYKHIKSPDNKLESFTFYDYKLKNRNTYIPICYKTSETNLFDFNNMKFVFDDNNYTNDGGHFYDVREGRYMTDFNKAFKYIECVTHDYDYRTIPKNVKHLKVLGDGKELTDSDIKEIVELRNRRR